MVADPGVFRGSDPDQIFLTVGSRCFSVSSVPNFPINYIEFNIVRKKTKGEFC